MAKISTVKEQEQAPVVPAGGYPPSEILFVLVKRARANGSVGYTMCKGGSPCTYNGVTIYGNENPKNGNIIISVRTGAAARAGTELANVFKSLA